MRIWSLMLITPDWKMWIHLCSSLFLYLRTLKSAIYASHKWNKHYAFVIKRTSTPESNNTCLLFFLHISTVRLDKLTFKALYEQHFFRHPFNLKTILHFAICLMNQFFSKRTYNACSCKCSFYPYARFTDFTSYALNMSTRSGRV